MFRLITSLALSLLALTPTDARSDVIDLMIVWDTAAFGMGNRSIDAALIVNEANTALSNSDVPHSFNLKYSHSSQALLFTAGDAQAALSFLKTHQQVRQLRDANNVDVIIMLAGNLTGTEGNTCGLAELPGRPSLLFSETLHVAVIKRSCWAISAYSVAAHELGHLLSAEHEYIRDLSPNDPVNYNHADINDQHKRQTVMASSEVAQQIPGYGAVHPVLIQKDNRGLLSDEAARQLSEVMEEIAEHGVLRVWAEANIRYTHRVPTDPAYASQMRRIRALQHRIVANLASAMSELTPGEVYPAEGPFVAVTVNEVGARALVADLNVQAICFLMPVY